VQDFLDGADAGDGEDEKEESGARCIGEVEVVTIDRIDSESSKRARHHGLRS
jgi:hypothetical protein